MISDTVQGPPKEVLVRRYRFGRLAASVAAVYLATIAVLTVVALVTGEEDLIWQVVMHEPATGGLTAVWWVVLALVLIGAVQGSACWQILRGRMVWAARSAHELTGPRPWPALPVTR